MRYLNTKPSDGTRLVRLPKAGCMWCLYALRPGNEGICETCRLRFKAMLNSVKWRKMRKARLSENPLCQDCGAVDSHVLDHIFSWFLYPDLFWHAEHTQCLCDACHNRKGINYDGVLGANRRHVGECPPDQGI